jgi:hypothetical protein
VVDPKEQVAYLRAPRAIREQCGVIFERAADGGSAHFTVRLDRMPEAVDYVTAVTKANYPDGNIPYHSRWRHFDTGGIDRVKRLDEKLAGQPPELICQAKMELAIVSVLLDAGAGPRWTYKEESTGKTYARSEGLAVASFDMFMEGYFSSDPDDPCRVDPAGLRSIGKRELQAAFQVSAENPLVGFDGRLSLMTKLASAISSHKRHFGEFEPRLGGLFDYLVTQSANAKLPARKILLAVLESLGTIWPGRTIIAGVNLGDCWRHPALDPEGPARGYVPFHKLSQWLTYSLCEPLEECGIEITGIEELTGLPEYRNGGLFLDLGILEAKNPMLLSEPHKPDEEAVIEWRALTVVLLDSLADAMRDKLGKSELDLPLAKVLQGGTWTAGRKIAEEKRPGGAPPITIQSDGTVF